MKKGCEYCKALESEDTPLIYEDDLIAAYAHPSPAVKGHIIIVPKEHHPIIELVPDYVIARLFEIANKLSIALFDELKVEGTNMLVQNGIPAGQSVAHFSVHLIPRKQGDGLDFQWQTKQLTEEEMSTIELKYKEETSLIGEFDKEKTQELIEETPSENPPEETGDDMRVDKLRRIPKW